MGKPEYFRLHMPHNLRRALHHDYKRPGYYLITLSKHPSVPDFSYIVGDLRNPNDAPRTILNPSGQIIAKRLELLGNSSRFEFPGYVVMPDHVHILWRVKEWLTRDLGGHIANFKSKCLVDWKTANPGLSDEAEFFSPKFNDKIGYDMPMVDRFFRYISDNPRRRLIAMLHPELFRKASKVRILDKEMDVFGNFQLLKHPLISAVVVSRRDSEEEKRRKAAEWEEIIRSGGVLISAFISDREKEIMHRGIEGGASIIRIVADGIGSRYKPSGREFELCCEGRCLHIGFPKASAHTDALSREFCMQLNHLARWLASHPAERMQLLPG